MRVPGRRTTGPDARTLLRSRNRPGKPYAATSTMGLRRKRLQASAGSIDPVSAGLPAEVILNPKQKILPGDPGRIFSSSGDRI